MSDTNSKEANLARVRDNQRRSRARRKEYLTELEAKYQNCEKVGIEASADIQAAAKTVIEENKRLRALLQRWGVPDEEVDSSGAGSPSSNNSGAASRLETMISQRRACGENSNRALKQNATSPSSISALKSSSDSGRSTPQVPALDSHAFEVLDRWADGSRFNATGPNQLAETQAYSHFSGQRTDSHNLHNSQHLQYPQQPHSAEPNWSTLSDTNTEHTVSASPTTDAWSYQGFPLADQALEQSACATTCYEIADAVRSVRPDAGLELEAELGCQDFSNCEVDNMQAFDVLDRWSDGSRAYATGPPGR